MEQILPSLKCVTYWSQRRREVHVAYGTTCFSGEYTTLHNFKHNAEQPLPHLTVQLSGEKLHQLNDQDRRYVNRDAPCYKVPVFLQHTKESTVDIQ